MATPTKPRHNAPRNDLTAEFVREIFTYDPDSGELRWKKNINRMHKIGKLAGWTRGSKYSRIVINKKWYYTHRIIYLYMTGTWPPKEVDHVLGNAQDNRWEKLRAATPQQNKWNSKIRSTNTTGFKGVSFRVGSKLPWFARLFVNGKNMYLGSYATREQAYATYCEAVKRYHKEFANVDHGRNTDLSAEL